MAEWYALEQGKLANGVSGQFILAEHNCAISNVAESFPSVCGHELEMFAAVLPDCTVERTHWINDGEHQCGYLIQAPS
jgi:DeoR family suf operon transcriptional repressor